MSTTFLCGLRLRLSGERKPCAPFILRKRVPTCRACVPVGGRQSKFGYKKTPSAKSVLRDNHGVAAGSSKGNRTPDFALRGRRLNRLTMEPDWLGN